MQAGDGLLLEPLARVALRDPGPLGQLGRASSGPCSGQRPVQAELGAEVDREQLERAERGAEQALGERLGCGSRAKIGGSLARRPRSMPL